MTIAPNGVIFIKPDPQNRKRIFIPSFESLINALSGNERGRIEHLFPNDNFTVNYNFMFSVKPTLFGIYKYFQGAWKGFGHLFSPSKSAPNPPSLMWKRDNVEDQISIPDLDHFKSLLSDSEIPLAFLGFLLDTAFVHADKQQSHAIAKILLAVTWLADDQNNKKLKSMFNTKLGSLADSILADMSDSTLEDWIINLPICFKVDPLAKVSNGAS